MTQYVQNFNLQIPHDHTCRGSLKIQSRSSRLYFKTGRSCLYNFPLASLVSKPKQIFTRKLLIKEEKRTSYRDVNMKQDKVKVANLSGSIYMCSPACNQKQSYTDVLENGCS